MKKKTEPDSSISQAIDTYTEQALNSYGAYVVMGRALSDWRDGLKPVQRRIAYAAWVRRAQPDRAHQKSSAIVGSTLGAYHPHGDASIYDSLVGMVGARYPLLEGHGNFGGPLFEPAAARYTECRLSSFGASCFDDIAIAAMTPNYSATEDEPVTLPVRAPLLVLNGSSGIGLGISGCIPPHNLREVLDALTRLVRDPAVQDDTLLADVVGPDYGSGVLCSSREDILALYRTGSGTLAYRCEYQVTEQDGQHIVTITSTAPGWSAQSFLQTMTRLVADGTLLYCSNQSDASFRVVVGCQDGRIAQKRVIPHLHTTVTYDFWAVQRNGDDTPLRGNVQHFTFRGLLEAFLQYRHDVEERRLSELREQQQNRLARHQALLWASQHLEIVKAELSYSYGTRAECAAGIVAAFAAIGITMTVEQADTILGESLWRLSRSQADDLARTVQQDQHVIQEIEASLADIPGTILTTLESMRRYVDDRGTRWSTRRVRVDADAMTWVAARTVPGPLVRSTDVPVRARVYYDRLVPAREHIWVIEAGSCKIQRRDVAFLNDQPLNLVGLSSDLYPLLLVLDPNQNGLIVHPRSGHNLGGMLEVADARGCRPGDHLLLRDAADNVMLVPVRESSRRARPGPLGLLPKPIVSVQVVPAGAQVVDAAGQIVSGMVKTKTAWIVGDLNYALLSDGRRVLSRTDTMTAILNHQMLQTTCVESKDKQ